MADGLTPDKLQEQYNKIKQGSMEQNYVNSVQSDQRDINQWQDYKDSYDYSRRALYTPLAGKEIPDMLSEYERLAVPWKYGSQYNQDNLADQQGTWEQLGNAGQKFVFNTLYDIAGGVGSMLDFPDYFNTDDEVGNWLTNWATEQKKQNDAATPIYQRTNAAAFGPGAFAWWLENGTNLASSATAFIAQGGAVTKGLGAVKWLASLGQTSKLANLAKKGTAAKRGTDLATGAKYADKAAKGLSGQSIRNIEKAEDFADRVITSTMLNQSEAIGAATQVYDKVYQDAIRRGYGEDYAKKVAAMSATNTINLNRWNIALNLTSADMFLKGSNNISNIANKKLWKEALIKEGGQEFLEENINLIAQKQGERYGKEALDSGKEPGELAEGLRMIDWTNPYYDASTKEMFETGLLGWLGGAAQTAGTSTIYNNLGSEDSKGVIGRLPGVGDSWVKYRSRLFGKKEADRYEQNEYYPDGSIKHQKGDIKYEMEESKYNEDVYYDNGEVLTESNISKDAEKQGYKVGDVIKDKEGVKKHEKGETITVKDKEGNEVAKLQPKLDANGRPIVQYKQGKFGDKRFSVNELQKQRTQRQQELIDNFRDSIDKNAKMISTARYQRGIEDTITKLDGVINSGVNMSNESKLDVFEDLARMEMINEGSLEISQDKVNERAQQMLEEYNSGNMNEKQLRQKQEELLNFSLARTALSAFENQNKDGLVGMYKDIQKLTPEQAMEKGYSENYKEDAQKAIDKIERYHNMWVEYSAKHDQDIAKALFKNRIKSEALSDNMLELDEKSKTLHEEQIKRLASENDTSTGYIDDNGESIGDKYNKAINIERERNKKLKSDKELNDLYKRRNELRRERDKLVKNPDADSTPKEIKDSLDKVEKELDSTAKRVDARVKEISKPFNDRVKALGLEGVNSKLKSQSELYYQKLDLINQSKQLDKTFDRLRSERGRMELQSMKEKEALDRYRARVLREYLEGLLALQNQGGGVYWGKDNMMPGKVVKRGPNEWYYAVDNEAPFAVIEEAVNNYLSQVKPGKEEAFEKYKQKRLDANNEKRKSLEAKIKELKDKLLSPDAIKGDGTTKEKAAKLDKEIDAINNAIKKNEEAIAAIDDNIMPPPSMAMYKSTKGTDENSGLVIISQNNERDGLQKLWFKQGDKYKVVNASTVIPKGAEIYRGPDVKNLEKVGSLQNEKGDATYSLDLENESVDLLDSATLLIPLDFEQTSQMIGLEKEASDMLRARRDYQKAYLTRISRFKRLFDIQNGLLTEKRNQHEDAVKSVKEISAYLAKFNEWKTQIETGTLADDALIKEESTLVKYNQLISELQGYADSLVDDKAEELDKSLKQYAKDLVKLRDDLQTNEKFIRDFEAQIRDYKNRIANETRAKSKAALKGHLTRLTKKLKEVKRQRNNIKSKIRFREDQALKYEAFKTALDTVKQFPSNFIEQELNNYQIQTKELEKNLNEVKDSVRTLQEALVEYDQQIDLLERTRLEIYNLLDQKKKRDKNRTTEKRISELENSIINLLNANRLFSSDEFNERLINRILDKIESGESIADLLPKNVASQNKKNTIESLTKMVDEIQKLYKERVEVPKSTIDFDKLSTESLIREIQDIENRLIMIRVAKDDAREQLDDRQTITRKLNRHIDKLAKINKSTINFLSRVDKELKNRTPELQQEIQNGLDAVVERKNQGIRKIQETWQLMAKLKQEHDQVIEDMTQLNEWYEVLNSHRETYLNNNEEINDLTQMTEEVFERIASGDFVKQLQEELDLINAEIDELQQGRSALKTGLKLTDEFLNENKIQSKITELEKELEKLEEEKPYAWKKKTEQTVAEINRLRDLIDLRRGDTQIAQQIDEAEERARLRQAPVDAEINDNFTANDQARDAWKPADIENLTAKKENLERRLELAKQLYSEDEATGYKNVLFQEELRDARNQQAENQFNENNNNQTLNQREDSIEQIQKELNNSWQASKNTIFASMNAHLKFDEKRKFNADGTPVLTKDEHDIRAIKFLNSFGNNKQGLVDNFNIQFIQLSKEENGKRVARYPNVKINDLPFWENQDTQKGTLLEADSENPGIYLVVTNKKGEWAYTNDDGDIKYGLDGENDANYFPVFTTMSSGKNPNHIGENMTFAWLQDRGLTGTRTKWSTLMKDKKDIQIDGKTFKLSTDPKSEIQQYIRSRIMKEMSDFRNNITAMLDTDKNVYTNITGLSDGDLMRYQEGKSSKDFLYSEDFKGFKFTSMGKGKVTPLKGYDRSVVSGVAYLEMNDGTLIDTYSDSLSNDDIKLAIKLINDIKPTSDTWNTASTYKDNKGEDVELNIVNQKVGGRVTPANTGLINKLFNWAGKGDKNYPFSIWIEKNAIRYIKPGSNKESYVALDHIRDLLTSYPNINDLDIDKFIADNINKSGKAKYVAEFLDFMKKKKKHVSFNLLNNPRQKEYYHPELNKKGEVVVRKYSANKNTTNAYVTFLAESGTLKTNAIPSAKVDKLGSTNVGRYFKFNPVVASELDMVGKEVKIPTLQLKGRTLNNGDTLYLNNVEGKVQNVGNKLTWVSTENGTSQDINANNIGTFEWNIQAPSTPSTPMKVSALVDGDYMEIKHNIKIEQGKEVVNPSIMLKQVDGKTHVKFSRIYFDDKGNPTKHLTAFYVIEDGKYKLSPNSQQYFKDEMNTLSKLKTASLPPNATDLIKGAYSPGTTINGINIDNFSDPNDVFSVFIFADLGRAQGGMRQEYEGISDIFLNLLPDLNKGDSISSNNFNISRVKKKNDNGGIDTFYQVRNRQYDQSNIIMDYKPARGQNIKNINDLRNRDLLNANQKALVAELGLNNVNVEFSPTINEAAAYYEDDNLITLSLGSFVKMDKETIGNTLIHELVHAATFGRNGGKDMRKIASKELSDFKALRDAIIDNLIAKAKSGQLQPILDRFGNAPAGNTQINRLAYYLIGDIPANKVNHVNFFIDALTNSNNATEFDAKYDKREGYDTVEMIANMFNSPVFLEYMNDMKMSELTTYQGEIDTQTVFEKFLNLFKNLAAAMGINIKSDSVLQQAVLKGSKVLNEYGAKLTASNKPVILDKGVRPQVQQTQQVKPTVPQTTTPVKTVSNVLKPSNVDVDKYITAPDRRGNLRNDMVFDQDNNEAIYVIGKDGNIYFKDQAAFNRAKQMRSELIESMFTGFTDQHKDANLSELEISVFPTIVPEGAGYTIKTRGQFAPLQSKAQPTQPVQTDDFGVVFAKLSDELLVEGYPLSDINSIENSIKNSVDPIAKLNELYNEVKSGNFNNIDDTLVPFSLSTTPESITDIVNPNILIESYEKLSKGEEANLLDVFNEILTEQEYYEFSSKLYNDADLIEATRSNNSREVINAYLDQMYEDYVSGTLDKEYLNKIFDLMENWFNDNQNKLTSKTFQNMTDASFALSSDFNIEGYEYTQSDINNVFDGMTYFLFDVFRKQNADTFFNNEINIQEVYESVYKNVKTSFDAVVEVLTTPNWNHSNYKSGPRFKASQLRNNLIQVQKLKTVDPQRYQIESANVQGLIDNILGVHKSLFIDPEGSKRFNELAKRHTEKMRSYGLKITEDAIEESMFENESEAVRDRAFNKNSIEFNTKDSLPSGIKMLIASLTNKMYNANLSNDKGRPIYEVVTNEFGLPSPNEFDKVYNFIAKNMANLPADFQIMLSELAQLNEREKTQSRNGSVIAGLLDDRNALLKRLTNSNGEANTNVTLNEIQLITQFVQSFSKFTPKFYTGRVDTDGTLHFFDSNQRKTSNNLVRSWSDNYQANLTETTEGDRKLSKKQVKETLDLIESARGSQGDRQLRYINQALNNLGITLDRIKVIDDRLSAKGKSLIERISAKGSIEDTLRKQYVDAKEELFDYDLFADDKISGTLKELADLEANNSNQIIDNQFMNAEGKTVYGITLNHFMSLVSSEINHYSKMKDENGDSLMRTKLPHLYNVFNRNSEMLERLENDDVKLEIGLFNGITDKASGSSGSVIKDVGAADRWAMIIAGTLNGHYTFFRAADRSLENSIKLVDSNGAVVPLYEGNRTRALSAHYDYLLDDIRAMVAHRDGLGKDLKYYKDKGGNFRYFGDGRIGAYADDIMDLINSGIDYDTIVSKLNETGIKNQLKKFFQDKADATIETIDNLGLLDLVDDKAKKVEKYDEVKKEYVLVDKDNARGMYYEGISADLMTKYLGQNKPTEANYKKALKQLIYDFELFQQGAYIEQNKILVGDPAMYKNENDFFKRMSMFNSTKKASITNETLDSILNQTNSVSLFEEDNAVNFNLTNSELKKLIENDYDISKALNSKRRKQLKSKLKGNLSNITIVPNIGFNPSYIQSDKAYDGELTSMIIEDVGVTATAAIDDVVSLGVENGKVQYYNEQGNKVKPSLLRETFAESFYNDGITNPDVLTAKVDSYINSYRGMDEADAQAYVTLPAYKEVLLRSGDWSYKHEKAYQKAIMGKPLSNEDLFVFRVLKTQFTGPLGLKDSSNIPNVDNTTTVTSDLENQNLFVPTGYKHSIFPLVPELIKGTNLEKLNDVMMSNGINMAHMESANKYGRKLRKNGTNKLYDSAGNFVLDKNEVLAQDTSFRWIGIQVDQAPKLKGKVTASTQFRKLILSNMIESGTPADYRETEFNRLKGEDFTDGMTDDEIYDLANTNWNELKNSSKAEAIKASGLYSMYDEYQQLQEQLFSAPFDRLVTELDLEAILDNDGNIEGYQINNRDAIVDIISEMAKDRNSPDSVKDSIEELRKESTYIEQVLNKEKVENVLFAIVNSRVIREKRKGEGSPQVAVSGFEPKGATREGASGKFYSSKTLNWYRKGKKGQTLPAECMIAVPKKLIPWINSKYGSLDGFNERIQKLHDKLAKIEERGSIIKLNEEDQMIKGLITTIGFRIPNQGLNSSEFMRVRRFLPYTAGDSVVVPTEMVGKAGSDFDIDKLSMYYPNFRLGKNGPILAKYMDDKNSTVEDRYTSYIMRESSEKVDYDALYEGYNEKQSEIDDIKSNLDAINQELTDVENVADGRSLFHAVPSKTLKDGYKDLNSQFNDRDWTGLQKQVGFLDATIKLIEMVDNLSNDEVIAEFNLPNDDIDYFVKTLKDLYDYYYSQTAPEVVAKLEELRGERDSKIKSIKDLSKEKFQIKKEAFMDLATTLATKNNLPTLEEFKQFSIPKQNSTQAVQNRMLDLHTEIISDEYNFRQLVAPISDGILTDTGYGSVWDIRFSQSTKFDRGFSSNYAPKIDLRTNQIILINELIGEHTSNNPTVKNVVLPNGEIIQAEDLEISNGEITYEGQDVHPQSVTFTDEANERYTSEMIKSYMEAQKNWVKVDKARREGKPLADVISPKVNLDKFIYFLSGKAGVGQTAVHITHHQLAMATNLFYNEDVNYWIHDHNTVNGKPSFSHKKDKDGEWVSETLSAFLNAYVDIAKDPYIFDLNAGNSTANMIFMLLRSGASTKWVTRFLSQPIIKDYVKMQSRNESYFKKAYGSEKGKGSLVKDIMQKYGETDPNRNYIYSVNTEMDRKIDEEFMKWQETSNEADREELKKRAEAIKTEFADKNLDTWNEYNSMKDAGLFSIDRLGDYISYSPEVIGKEGTDPDILYARDGFWIENRDLYNKIQRSLLDTFLEYQRQSRQFQMMIRATSPDTKGLGKNLKSNELSVAELDKVKFIDSFGNLDKMFTDTIINVPSKVIDNSIKMFKTMYWTKQNQVVADKTLELFNKVKSAVSLNQQNSSRLKDTIDNELITAIITMDDVNNPYAAKTVFEELFITSDKNTYVDSKGKLAPLPKIIQELKDKQLNLSQVRRDYNKAKKNNEFTRMPSVLKFADLRTNSFINELRGKMPKKTFSSYSGMNSKTSISMNNPEFSTIHMNNRGMTTDKENTITNAARVIKERHPDLYNDLLRFTMNQSGLMSSNISWTKYMPPEDVNAVTKAALENFNVLDKGAQEDLLNQFQKQFLTRTVRYNPTVNRIKSSWIDNRKDSKTKGKLKRSYSMPADSALVQNYPFLLRVTNNKQTGDRIRAAVAPIIKKNKKGTSMAYYSNFRGSFSGRGSNTPIVGYDRFFTGYTLRLDSSSVIKPAINVEQNTSVKTIDIDEVSRVLKETLTELGSFATPTIQLIGHKRTVSLVTDLSFDSLKENESKIADVLGIPSIFIMKDPDEKSTYRLYSSDWKVVNNVDAALREFGDQLADAYNWGINEPPTSDVPYSLDIDTMENKGITMANKALEEAKKDRCNK